jgi:hypothetical protein
VAFSIALYAQAEVLLRHEADAAKPGRRFALGIACGLEPRAEP